ncbi:MAG: LuxR C-terminal-related transcriptional regulator [Myxococcota bacterium]
MEERTKTVATHDPRGDLGPLCLRIIEGTTPRPPLVLDDQPLILGRERGVGMFLEAEGISRRHSKITGSDRQYTIIDLGSKNGTFVNWEQVEMASLRPGDRIGIGKIALRFDWLESPTQHPGDPVIEPQVLAARQLLSPRELEVAELVGKGMTNVEIGRELGISRRTVATHLERAYERLGIHSRAALVRRILGHKR